jgi:hypothetical protein
METPESKQLRDVAMQIENLARRHPAWSMVHEIIFNATNHICAKAAIIEMRS